MVALTSRDNDDVLFSCHAARSSGQLHVEQMVGKKLNIVHAVVLKGDSSMSLKLT